MYPPRTPDDARDPNAQPRTWGGLVLATALVVAVPVALLAAVESPATVVGLCGVGVVTAVTAYAARRRGGGAASADRDRTAPDSTASDSGTFDSLADAPASCESDSRRTTDRESVYRSPLDVQTGSTAERACRRSD